MIGEGAVMVEARFMASDWDASKPFRENLTAVMREARGGGHMGWLTGEEDQFKAAVGAAFLACGEDDRRWLEAQMAALRKFSAFVHASREGIPVDVESFAASMEEVPKVDRDYQLLELWRETKP